MWNILFFYCGRWIIEVEDFKKPNARLNIKWVSKFDMTSGQLKLSWRRQVLAIHSHCCQFLASFWKNQAKQNSKAESHSVLIFVNINICQQKRKNGKNVFYFTFLLNWLETSWQSMAKAGLSWLSDVDSILVKQINALFWVTFNVYQITWSLIRQLSVSF